MKPHGGPQWEVNHQIPYHANFILWLKRRESQLASLPETIWRQWMEQAVKQQAEIPDRLFSLAPVPDLVRVAAQSFNRFAQEFDRYRSQAAPRLTQEVSRLDLREIMGDSNLQLTFLHTNHPGDLCWKVGATWVLGDSYGHAAPIRDLVRRIVFGEAPGA